MALPWRLTERRRDSEALKSGDFELLLPEHPQLFAYRRSYKGGGLIVSRTGELKAGTGKTARK